MARKGSPYGYSYEKARKAMLAESTVCHICGEDGANSADHVPALGLHQHVAGSGCCVLKPAHLKCNDKVGGWRVANERARMRKAEVELAAPEPVLVEEPNGFAVDSPVWDVAWLDELRNVPGDAVWPRLMTVPHPRAVGSLGGEFCAWCLERSGRPLRWWQQLVAVRLLEVDADGRLVWETLLLTLARQLGKSWLLREILLWRIHQGVRFGEPQAVLHTGKDLAVCKEVQLPARAWAKARDDLYHVREVNGQEEIELREDGSRWMLRAKHAVYGYSASLAGVDEAWKVQAAPVEDGLEATMVEREQPQLLLVSTAHRSATVLMLGRRTSALAVLDAPVDDGDLLMEWSAPRDCDLEDVDAWRLASPHWTERRERKIAKRYQAAMSGESDDEDEPDPVESFKAQWLNIWPARQARAGRGELLLSSETWTALADEHVWVEGPVVLAVEDWFGHGAAAAACAMGADGRLVLAGGGLFESRADAYGWLGRSTAAFPGSTLLVGASLAGDPALADLAVASIDTAGTSELRVGLSLLRELVRSGRVVHDGSEELAGQVCDARVTVLASGLSLVPGARSDLLRAVVWALKARHDASLGQLLVC